MNVRFLVGAAGIEPATHVPETWVLPLYQAPNLLHQEHNETERQSSGNHAFGKFIERADVDDKHHQHHHQPNNYDPFHSRGCRNRTGDS